MSNPPFTNDAEGCPECGLCIVSGAGAYHGLPVCLGAGETVLCRCQHAGGESNSGIREYWPVRDQMGTAIRIEERLRQSR